MIRVVLPQHLRTLSSCDGEVLLELPSEATIKDLLDHLEVQFPMLRGTIRDRVSGDRRPYVRFFAAGLDLSHDSVDSRLPDSVERGSEPFIVLGALAGG